MHDLHAFRFLLDYQVVYIFVQLRYPQALGAHRESVYHVSAFGRKFDMILTL